MALPLQIAEHGDSLTPVVSYGNVFTTTTYSSSQRKMKARHSGGVNILYGDGHVGYRKQGEVPDNNIIIDCYSKAFWYPLSTTASEW